MTGRRPFWDHKDDHDLMIKVHDGLRPSIDTNTAPEDYVILMQECWSSNQNRRPKASKISERLIDIRRVEMENPREIIKSLDIGPITTNNSDASCAISIVSSSSSEQGN